MFYTQLFNVSLNFFNFFLKICIKYQKTKFVHCTQQNFWCYNVFTMGLAVISLVDIYFLISSDHHFCLNYRLYASNTKYTFLHQIDLKRLDFYRSSYNTIYYYFYQKIVSTFRYNCINNNNTNHKYK